MLQCGYVVIYFLLQFWLLQLHLYMTLLYSYSFHMGCDSSYNGDTSWYMIYVRMSVPHGI